MPHPALLAFIAAAFLALVAVAYLWRVQRARFVVSEGIRALAAMRWREFSQFVITALQAQGFEAHPLSSTGNANEPVDLLLTRDDRSWLLSCRQSADYRVTERQVEDMRRAVGSRSAAGGIIVTLGQVDAQARRGADDIELIDGRTLWPLIAPLLPPSLHEHLAERAQARTRRATAGALGAATVLGAGLALGSLGRDDRPVAAIAPVPPAARAPAPRPAAGPAATDASTGIATPPAPASSASAAGGRSSAPAPAPDVDNALPADLPPEERRQREQIVDALARVPGIEHAAWSTRSTLVLQMAEGATDPRDPICNVMRRFEMLRASRIQLQPPAGRGAQVRFFHCAAY